MNFGTLLPALIGLILSAPMAIATTTLKINGSTTVNPVVVEAAEAWQKSRGWQIFVDTQGGSGGGIAHLAEGMVDIGMISRPVTEHDHKTFPGVRFVAHTIGYDGVALVVPKALYEGGIKALSRDEIQSIYEQRVNNWRQLGGPDLKVVFFNKEPGRGTWETFAEFVYGKADLAPKAFHLEVGSNQEALAKVGRTPGAMTQLSAAWINDDIRGVALKVGDASVEPSLANIRAGTYPIKRPLNLVTVGEPTGAVLEFVNFIKSPPGQELVARYGFIPLPPTSGQGS